MFFTTVEALDFLLYQEQVTFSFAISECLVKSSITSNLFVCFVSNRKGCQYFSIRTASLAVTNFLIIFMFVEFLIKKLSQSSSARTGFTPMRYAFGALRVVNDLFNRFFVCQVAVSFINLQHNVLMSATNPNRVIHFWASQNTPFWSKGTELWEPNIYIWVFFFKSSI